MADGRDTNNGGGQRAFQLDMGAATWSLAGGWTEPDAVGFNIITAQGERFRIRVPFDIDYDDGRPILLIPEVSDGWDR